jgi:hypothetical protein
MQAIELRERRPSTQTAEHNPLFFGRKNRQYETKQTLGVHQSAQRESLFTSRCESEHECGHTRVLLEETHLNEERWCWGTEISASDGTKFHTRKGVRAAKGWGAGNDT